MALEGPQPLAPLEEPQPLATRLQRQEPPPQPPLHLPKVLVERAARPAGPSAGEATAVGASEEVGRSARGSAERVDVRPRALFLPALSAAWPPRPARF